MQDIVLDIRKIATLLPHRYPFLLVDRVISMSDPGGPTRVGKKAVGIKNVTFNEPHFTGHFPDLPIMPGVLQIEAMAQLAGISYYRDGDPPMDFMIASLQDARFRKPVVPGDTMRISSEIIKDRGSMIQVATKCHVGEELVAEAVILAHVSPKSNREKV
jgi:3-hydroxyacyl-[acyl-carrier-protein] dehydratase